MDTYLAKLKTESVNAETGNIDRMSTAEMVSAINAQDALVAAAVASQTANIAAAVDIIYESLKAGGRLIYIGAGTSGRLGVLDASECLPTFGVGNDVVQGYIAGGDRALRHPVEGAEDSAEEGIALMETLEINEKDTLVGVSASGSATYVLEALRYAKERGTSTVGVCTNAGTKFETLCDVTIAPEVGAEVISGSTRMKSGTAQKMVLNMLTTCTMIKMGKVYGNLMVDLQATNKKLEDRAKRLISHVTGVETDVAAMYLEQAEGNVKRAIYMQKTGSDLERTLSDLAQADGRLALALEKRGGK